MAGNFLYPWARNKFLTQSSALAWSGAAYKVMFLNSGVSTSYIWSATGGSGYAWNPSNEVAGSNPAGAGYAVTWLSQIPTAHRTLSQSGSANTLGIISAISQGNGVADSSTASTTAYAVGNSLVVSAFVIYKDPTVTAGSSPSDTSSDLIAFFDSALGMPVTGNGGDITVVWDTTSNRIFKL
jgi:hypothetical protein